MTLKGMIFIDANQYLELYRTVSGKKLLAAIDEQRDYIFVTAQVVDEVHRNKVKVAASFLADQIKNEKVEQNSVAVPNDFVGVARACVQLCRLWWSRRFVRRSKKQREEFRKQAHDLLGLVSQSKDEVSTALTGIFSQAVAPSADELQHARERKERGNPPGKKTGPLGDELSWEQILSRCKDWPRLWIITKDSDYATKHEGRVFLNAALYEELAQLYRSSPEVSCFDNIDEGIRNFAITANVKAEKLPTPEEAKQIKEEQESLPPLGWLTDYDDAAQIAIQSAYRLRDSTMLRAALSSQAASEEVFPPPEAKEPDKNSP